MIVIITSGATSERDRVRCGSASSRRRSLRKVASISTRLAAAARRAPASGAEEHQADRQQGRAVQRQDGERHGARLACRDRAGRDRSTRASPRSCRTPAPRSLHPCGLHRRRPPEAAQSGERDDDRQSRAAAPVAGVRSGRRLAARSRRWRRPRRRRERSRRWATTRARRRRRSGAQSSSKQQLHDADHEARRQLAEHERVETRRCDQQARQRPPVMFVVQRHRRWRRSPRPGRT